MRSTLTPSIRSLADELWYMVMTSAENLQPASPPAIKLNEGNILDIFVKMIIEEGGEVSCQYEIEPLLKEISDYYTEVRGRMAKIEILDSEELPFKWGWGRRPHADIGVYAILWNRGDSYHLYINYEGFYYIP